MFRKITAVQHETEFLLVIHFIDTFILFKISTRGVNKPYQDNNHSYYSIGGYLLNALGYLKAKW
jgi:hypothetical protein